MQLVPFHEITSFIMLYLLEKTKLSHAVIHSTSFSSLQAQTYAPMHTVEIKELEKRSKVGQRKDSIQVVKVYLRFHKNTTIP